MRQRRNKLLIKQVIERDHGICCCCGFEADEAHHIVPIYKGGEDTIENMIAMCHMDHYYAPDTKEEFEEYVKNGGIRSNLIMGRSINYYLQHKEEYQNMSLEKAVEITKSLIDELRKNGVDYCNKKYGLK